MSSILNTEHGSLLEIRQVLLPQYASVNAAANICRHCSEVSSDGLMSRPGESVQLHSKLLALSKPDLSIGHVSLPDFQKLTARGLHFLVLTKSQRIHQVVVFSWKSVTAVLNKTRGLDSKFARQLVNSDVPSLLLHVPVT